MRDKWVALYVLLVFAQLPLYFAFGEGPLKFEFAVKEVEKKVQNYQGQEGAAEELAGSLDEVYGMLETMGDESSRLGRVKLNEGILAWKSGKPDEAVKALEESHKVFVDKHGVDSFHAAAIDVRLAELYYLRRQYQDAVVRYQRSSPKVRDYLGPRHPFVVRMAFREVSALTVLGRDGEAESVARANVELLKSVAAEQDSQFLRSTGGALDMLQRKGHFSGPPKEFGTWSSYLNSLSADVDSGKTKKSESDGF